MVRNRGNTSVVQVSIVWGRQFNHVTVFWAVYVWWVWRAEGIFSTERGKPERRKKCQTKSPKYEICWVMFATPGRCCARACTLRVDFVVGHDIEHTRSYVMPHMMQTSKTESPHLFGTPMTAFIPRTTYIGLTQLPPKKLRGHSCTRNSTHVLLKKDICCTSSTVLLVLCAHHNYVFPYIISMEQPPKALRRPFCPTNYCDPPCGEPFLRACPLWQTLSPPHTFHESP